jgi:hypothetical protein
LRPVTVHPYTVSTRLSAAAPPEEAVDARDANVAPVRQPVDSNAFDLQTSDRGAPDRQPTPPAPQPVDGDNGEGEPQAWLVREDRNASVPKHREPSSAPWPEQVYRPEQLQREPTTRDHSEVAAESVHRSPEFTMSPALPRADSDFRLLPEADMSVPHPALAEPLLPSGAHRGVAGSRGIRGTTRPDHSDPDAAPEVRVTIGRIEVTAQHAPPPARKRRHQPAGMSLDEYLSRRQQGGA